jgi:hypothetical protein
LRKAIKRGSCNFDIATCDVKNGSGTEEAVRQGYTKNYLQDRLGGILRILLLAFPGVPVMFERTDSPEAGDLNSMDILYTLPSFVVKEVFYDQ